MVTRSVSNCSNSSNDVDDDQDTASVTTTDDESHHNEIVLAEDINKDKPSFGNIAVTNSTDVHFGNKTFYQGPVTIKQFLYATPRTSNGEGEVSESDEKLAINSGSLVIDNVPDISRDVGKDNLSFVPDAVGIKEKQDNNQKVFNTNQHPPVRKGTKWLQKISRQHLLLVVSLIAVLLVSLVTLITVLFTRHPAVNKPLTSIHNGDSSEQDKATPVEYPVDPTENVTLPMSLRIISREEWLAKPPKEDPDLLELPVPYVIIMHTASESCTDEESCKSAVQSIQFFHAESRGWNDIGYSFLVGGDGNAYEGRGWKIVGAQVYGYNTRCIGIAFIGTFISVLPPERQITAAKLLIEMGVQLGYIAPDYKLVAARQLQTTQSPGLMLYEDIKTWPHWTATP